MAVPELPASISVCTLWQCGHEMTVHHQQHYHLVSVGTRMEPITAHPDMCNSAITESRSYQVAIDAITSWSLVYSLHDINENYQQLLCLIVCRAARCSLALISTQNNRPSCEHLLFYPLLTCRLLYVFCILLFLFHSCSIFAVT